MPPMPKLTLVKQFTYRGQPEEWSNSYYFSGGVPPDADSWKLWADAVWNQERELLDDTVKIHAAYGYLPGAEVSHFQHAYYDVPASQTTGTLTGSPDNPGDVAMWVRWSLPNRNSKGRPVYLRKYFHGVVGTGGDALGSTLVQRANAYATTMKDGSLPGGLRICGAQGAVAGAHKISPWFTTRSLKRRGKRPTSP